VNNTAEELLILKRRDKDGQIGAWQLPQGGLDLGEEPRDAAKRELDEETGLATPVVELIGELREWIAYELPEGYRTKKTGRGQVQKWFLCRFGGGDSDIDLTKPPVEFEQYVWGSFDDLLRLTIAFRRPVYHRVASALRAGEYDTLK